MPWYRRRRTSDRPEGVSALRRLPRRGPCVSSTTTCTVRIQSTCMHAWSHPQAKALGSRPSIRQEHGCTGPPTPGIQRGLSPTNAILHRRLSPFTASEVPLHLVIFWGSCRLLGRLALGSVTARPWCLIFFLLILPFPSPVPSRQGRCDPHIVVWCMYVLWYAASGQSILDQDKRRGKTLELESARINRPCLVFSPAGCSPFPRKAKIKKKEETKKTKKKKTTKNSRTPRRPPIFETTLLGLVSS